MVILNRMHKTQEVFRPLFGCPVWLVGGRISVACILRKRSGKESVVERIANVNQEREIEKSPDKKM